MYILYILFRLFLSHIYIYIYRYAFLTGVSTAAHPDGKGTVDEREAAKGV